MSEAREALKLTLMNLDRSIIGAKKRVLQIEDNTLGSNFAKISYSEVIIPFLTSIREGLKDWIDTSKELDQMKPVEALLLLAVNVAEKIKELESAKSEVSSELELSMHNICIEVCKQFIDELTEQAEFHVIDVKEKELKEAAARLDPVVAFWYTKATTLFKQEQYSYASDYFGLVIGKDTILETLALANRGKCYAKLGNHQEAIAGFSRALQHTPINPQVRAEILANRAIAYWELKDSEKALDDIDLATGIYLMLGDYINHAMFTAMSSNWRTTLHKQEIQTRQETSEELSKPTVQQKQSSIVETFPTPVQNNQQEPTPNNLEDPQKQKDTFSDSEAYGCLFFLALGLLLIFAVGGVGAVVTVVSVAAIISYLIADTTKSNKS